MDEPFEVMSQSILEILKNLEAEAETRGWDAPPSLFWLRREGPVSVAGMAEIMKIEMQQLPVPLSLWEEAEHPVGVLLHLVSFFERPECKIPDLLGFVLNVEAWSVQMDPDDVAGQDQMMAAANERRLHRHPKRVETRVVNCIDVAGQNYLVMRQRDGDVLAEVASTYQGAIPDALQALVEAAAMDPNL